MGSDLERAGFVLESSWTQTNRRSRFSGIAYTDNEIIVGQEGYAKFIKKKKKYNFLELREGRFCVIEYTKTALFARVDAFGQEMLYFYNDKKHWGISNSFLALAEHLCSHGIKLHADVDSMRIGFIPGALGQSPISNDTYISEIKTLPADFYIKINFLPESFSFEFNKIENLSNSGAVSEEEYVESLLSFVGKAASRSRAIMDSYRERFRVDITGGQDSRLVLGVLSATGADLGGINFHSNKAWQEDYRVASELGSAVGFKIQHKPIPISKTSVEESFKLWKLGNVGVYMPVYSAIGNAPQSSLHFHGACGENYRDYYGTTGQRLLERIKEAYPGSIADAFAKQLKSAFRDMGEDISSPDSMMIHYRNFRSRFHFGRSVYKNLNAILITPLASLDLINATRYLTEDRRKKFQLALDIYLLVNRKLAQISFDDPKKNFTAADISKSPFNKRAPRFRDRLRDMEVFRGDFETSTQAAPGGSFREWLLRDLAGVSEAAKSLGIFPDNYDIDAAEKVRTGARLTMDAMQASHMISVGHVIKLVHGTRSQTRAPVRQTFSMSKNAKLSARLANGQISAEFEIKAPQLEHELEYAFYLVSERGRESTKWYSDSKTVEFAVPADGFGLNYRINGFIRKRRDPSSKWSVFADVERH